MSHPALAELLASAEIAVVPSLYEGFSLPALEHMASGTPLVASRTGALPEVTGDAAVLVTPGEDEELAAMLRRLYHSPAERAALADRGLRRGGGGVRGARGGPGPGGAVPGREGRARPQNRQDRQDHQDHQDHQERTGRVLTVDFRRFPVRPGHRVLDLGCGGGRHAFELYRRGAD